MSTRKVLAFSYLDRYSSLVFAIISSIILARLLTPSEMGVFSVTMILLSFATPFKDLGASQYLIREKNLEPSMVRAAWTVQLSMGMVLAILAYSIDQMVADFYRDPRIKDIIFVLSLNFALGPFGTLTIALLSREMKFGSIAIIRFVSTLTGNTMAIGCAFAGLGPISLAYGLLSSNMISALVSLWFRPKGTPWLPGFVGLRKVLTFGSAVSGTSMMNIIYEGAPELILGRLQGMTETGLFGRGKGLVSIFERLIMDGVYAAAMPIFSQRLRRGESIAEIFVKAVGLISGIGWPLLSFIALFAYPLMQLLYGPKWDDAVDLARILSIAMSMLLPALLCGPPLIALGRVRTVFWLTTTNALMQVGVSVVGARLGLESLGVGIVISSLLIATLWLRFARPLILFAWYDFRLMLFKSAIVTAGTMTVPIIVVFFFGLRPGATLTSLMIGGLGALCGYLYTARAVGHPVWDEIDQIVLRRIGFSKPKL